MRIKVQQTNCKNTTFNVKNEDSNWIYLADVGTGIGK